MKTKYVTTREMLTCHILRGKFSHNEVCRVIIYNNLLNVIIYDTYTINQRFEIEMDEYYNLYEGITFFLNRYFNQYSEIHNKQYPSILGKNLFVVEYLYEYNKFEPVLIKTSKHSLFDCFLLDYSLADNNWGVKSLDIKLPKVEGVWTQDLFDYRFCWKFFGSLGVEMKWSDNIKLDKKIDFIFKILHLGTKEYYENDYEPFFEVNTDITKL